jgi:hypothetical protein
MAFSADWSILAAFLESVLQDQKERKERRNIKKKECFLMFAKNNCRTQMTRMKRIYADLCGLM